MYIFVCSQVWAPRMGRFAEENARHKRSTDEADREKRSLPRLGQRETFPRLGLYERTIPLPRLGLYDRATPFPRLGLRDEAEEEEFVNNEIRAFPRLGRWSCRWTREREVKGSNPPLVISKTEEEEDDNEKEEEEWEFVNNEIRDFHRLGTCRSS